MQNIDLIVLTDDGVCSMIAHMATVVGKKTG